MVVIVDRERFTLEVWKPGPGSAVAKRVYSCQVAVGMEGYATPRGAYETGPRSREPNWQAPSWVDAPLEADRIYTFDEPENPFRAGFISLHGAGPKGKQRSGYGIHGTKNEASIPGRASHGCIRVKAPDLEWLYVNLEDNTMVIVV